MATWSISAHNAFRRCQRQYYFQYIAANHNAKKDIWRRQAFIYKKLKNLKLWQGSLVDLGIQLYLIDALNNGETISHQKLINQTIELSKQQFNFSLTKSYWNRKNSSSDIGFCALYEHEYNQPITDDDLNHVFQTIELCYDNLFQISLPTNRHTLLIDLIKNASWKKANLQNLNYPMDEIKVSPQIDLLMFTNNKPIVVDWKIAESDSSNYSRQLMICALPILYKRNQYQPEDVIILEVNLLKNRIERYNLSKEKISEIEDFIFQSYSDIQMLVRNKSFYEQNIEDFDYANSPTVCYYCNFRKLCRSFSNKEYSSCDNIELIFSEF